MVVILFVNQKARRERGRGGRRTGYRSSRKGASGSHSSYAIWPAIGFDAKHEDDTVQEVAAALLLLLKESTLASKLVASKSSITSSPWLSLKVKQPALSKPISLLSPTPLLIKVSKPALLAPCLVWMCSNCFLQLHSCSAFDSSRLRGAGQGTCRFLGKASGRR